MASDSFDYQNNNNYNHTEAPPLSLHLCFFLLTLSLLMVLPLYLNYESAFEGLIDQLKFIIIMSPLLVLLVLYFLSSVGDYVPFMIPLPERESFHRAGGSPWGVGLLLVLLLFMVSYQSDVHERWFPLLSR